MELPLRSRQGGICVPARGKPHLDLHPDGRRLCAPVWVANGRAGNGRHTERDKYLPHFGHVQIYRLDEKPADEKKTP